MSSQGRARYPPWLPPTPPAPTPTVAVEEKRYSTFLSCGCRTDGSQKCRHHLVDDQQKQSKDKPRHELQNAIISVQTPAPPPLPRFGAEYAPTVARQFDLLPFSFSRNAVHTSYVMSPPLALHASYSIFTIAGHMFDNCRRGHADGLARWAKFDAPTAVTVIDSHVYVTDSNGAVRHIDKSPIYQYGSVRTLVAPPEDPIQTWLAERKYEMQKQRQKEKEQRMHLSKCNTDKENSRSEPISSSPQNHNADAMDITTLNVPSHEATSLTQVSAVASVINSCMLPSSSSSSSSSSSAASTLSSSSSPSMASCSSVGRPAELSDLVADLSLSLTSSSLSSTPLKSPFSIVSSPLYPSYLFISDPALHCIFVVHRASGQAFVLAGKRGECGRCDGFGSHARFHAPKGLAFDAYANLLVCDSTNQAIRRIRLPSWLQISTETVHPTGEMPYEEKTIYQKTSSSKKRRMTDTAAIGDSVEVEEQDRMNSEDDSKVPSMNARTRSADETAAEPSAKRGRYNASSIESLLSTSGALDGVDANGGLFTVSDFPASVNLEEAFVDSYFLHPSLLSPCSITVDTVGWLYVIDDIIQRVFAIGRKEWTESSINSELSQHASAFASTDQMKVEVIAPTLLTDCLPSLGAFADNDHMSASSGSAFLSSFQASHTLIAVDCDEDSLAIQRQMHLAMLTGREKAKDGCSSGAYDPNSFPTAPRLDLSNYQFTAICSDPSNSNVYVAAAHRTQASASAPAVFRMSSISPSFVTLVSQSTGLPYDTLCLIACYCDSGLPMIREKITAVPLFPPERLIRHYNGNANAAAVTTDVAVNNDGSAHAQEQAQAQGAPAGDGSGVDVLAAGPGGGGVGVAQTSSSLSHFSGICIDERENVLLLSDSGCHCIRALTLPHARTLKSSLMVRQRRRRILQEAQQPYSLST